MANQPETSNFDAGVYQFETSDPVQGGRGGLANAPLLNLANRTRWLYDQVNALIANLAGYATQGFVGQSVTGYNALLRQSVWTPYNAAASVAVPSWAANAEAILVGGGGGGSACQGPDTSGGGGGSGGYLKCRFAVTGGSQVTVTPGAAGAVQGTGGATSISYAGQVIAQATGGQGSSFAAGQISPGGAGGTTSVSSSATAVTVEISSTGNAGSDGQIGTRILVGNGAPGPWGGAGRVPAAVQQVSSLLTPLDRALAAAVPMIPIRPPTSMRAGRAAPGWSC